MRLDWTGLGSLGEFHAMDMIQGIDIDDSVGTVQVAGAGVCSWGDASDSSELCVGGCACSHLDPERAQYGGSFNGNQCALVDFQCIHNP